MPYRTLLIDDHRLFNDGLSLVLRESTDFIVAEQVYDSRLAVDTCARLTPDLVLVDFSMPHLDGLTVVKLLKQLPAPGKIVVISMYAEQREIDLFKALNVDGYIAKTVAADCLLTRLREVMQGQRVIETGSEPSLAAPAPTQPTYGLTKREMEILKRIKQGLTSEQIADELSLSFYTVQTHRKNISQKLPFSTKKQFYDFLTSLE